MKVGRIVRRTERENQIHHPQTTPNQYHLNAISSMQGVFLLLSIEPFYRVFVTMYDPSSVEHDLFGHREE